MGRQDTTEEHHGHWVSLLLFVYLHIIIISIRYDTYHDTVHKSKSVGALVASLNPSLTKYISSANIHDSPNSELDNTMKPAVMKALRKYREVNGCLPEKIIMYRYDGRFASKF